MQYVQDKFHVLLFNLVVFRTSLLIYQASGTDSHLYPKSYYCFCILTCQIRIWCSGTRKWSQRREVDHFCQGNISAIQPSEIPSESSRGTFACTHPTLDIHVRPGWRFRQLWDLRLGCSDLRLEHIFEIYGSSIGVCIFVIQSNQEKSSQVNSTHSLNKSQ